VRETNRVYREANREKVRGYQRKYQAKKRAKAKERLSPDATGWGDGLGSVRWVCGPPPARGAVTLRSEQSGAKVDNLSANQAPPLTVLAGGQHPADGGIPLSFNALFENELGQVLTSCSRKFTACERAFRAHHGLFCAAVPAVT
jgi:hypothetical protein